MKAPAQVPFLAYCMNCNAVCPGTRAGAFPFFGERRPPIRFPGLQVSWLHSVPTYTDKSEKQTWKKRRFFAIISMSCFLREKDTEKPGPVLLHKRGCRNNSPAKSKKAVVLYRKVLNNRLLCCIIELPKTKYKKARILYSNEKQKSSSFTIKFRNLHSERRSGIQVLSIVFRKFVSEKMK